MTAEFSRLWSGLAALPIFWLGATLLAFEIACWIRDRCGGSPLANPVLLAILMLGAALTATGVPYQTYFDGAKPIHLMLGPATVALAAPLYQNLGRIRQCAPAILSGVMVGGGVAAGAAVALAWAQGAPKDFLLSIASKSVTMPIALGISDEIGGHPSLTAVLVSMTGVLGAVIGTTVLDLIDVRDWRLRGLSIGVAAHGVGTAAILPLSETGGAFASLGMGLNGLFTAVMLPVAVHWIGG